MDNQDNEAHRRGQSGADARGNLVSSSRKVVLVTPNISEQMGGEAIKAYQFLRHLVNNGRDVAVVAHRRSASVLAHAIAVS